ncbi:hypothetical protein JXA47_12095 [Candidatus Sumerlaeota bacterium]|nr:hypothetical protein [Candidatus Sumerlaeota bacterium]
MFRVLGALSALIFMTAVMFTPAQDDFDVFGTVEGATANVSGAYAAPAQSYDPFAGDQPAPGYDPFGQQQTLAPQFAAPTPGAPTVTTAPLEPRIQVIRGQLIRDAVTGDLLEVPEMAEDLESNASLYSDDGRFGDVFAGDEIYTNVVTLDDVYIGPETHSIILLYINMLRLLAEMDPLAFSAVTVASPDPVSPLPQLEDYESHQDTRILDWNENFLRDFRQPTYDESVGDYVATDRSDFYPVYVPPPPYYRPVRPNPLEAMPPVDFMQQVWIAYQGGTPDPQAVTSVQPAQGGRGGAYPGVGEDPFGGSAGREWRGQSGYFGEQDRGQPPGGTGFDEFQR